MQGLIGSYGLSFALVVLLGAVTCGARPPRSDPTYGDVIQDGGSLDGNSLGVNGDSRQLNHLLSSPEETALAALQLQLLQQYSNINNARSPWEQFLRAPQDKRQIRYRQCYFNPISCFRK